jgi:hypothetical protein
VSLRDAFWVVVDGAAWLVDQGVQAARAGGTPLLGLLAVAAVVWVLIARYRA